MLEICFRKKRQCLGFLFLFHHQVGLDKAIQIPIHHWSHVPHFIVGSMVLDHFLRMEYITADLAAPLYFFLAGIGGVLQFFPFAQFFFVQTAFQHLHGLFPVAEL